MAVALGAVEGPVTAVAYDRWLRWYFRGGVLYGVSWLESAKSNSSGSVSIALVRMAMWSGRVGRPIRIGGFSGKVMRAWELGLRLSM